MPTKHHVKAFLQRKKIEQFYADDTCDDYQRDLALFAEYLETTGVIDWKLAKQSTILEFIGRLLRFYPVSRVFCDHLLIDQVIIETSNGG